MTGRILLLLAPLAAFALAAAAASAGETKDPAAKDKPAKCPEWLDGVPVPVEHASDVCDFKAENNPRVYSKNARDLHSSMNTGSLFQLKDEKTWVCPEDEGVTESEDYAPGHHPHTEPGSGGRRIAGPKTKWIVRNRSSNPVSVALVDTGRGNKEVSALNPNISPAHNDPDAVLAPGSWKALTVTLGTILHVRELISAGDDVSPGRVLIRHRPGPIAVRDATVKPIKKPPAPVPKKPSANKNNKKVGNDPNKKSGSTPAKDRGGSTVRDDGGRNLDSSSDVISLGGNKTSPASKARESAARQVLRPVLPDATPPLATRAEKEAQRGVFRFDRMCNSLTRLFVNRVGRPVDVYWAGASDLTTGSTAVSNRADDCEARYAFHLGLKSAPHEDFFEEWDSFMSLENTYLGHHFVARLASDHSKVLQEIVLDRTDVGDCVREREAEAAGRGKVGVAVQIGGKVEDAEAKNVMVHEIVVDGYSVAASNLTGSPAGLGAVGTAAA